MSDTVLLAGTRKGLFIGRAGADRSSWTWDKPLFPMEEIYSAAIDTRGGTPRLLAGATSPHWGPQVFRSDDLGRTWDETKGGAVRFPEDTGVGARASLAAAPGARWPGRRRLCRDRALCAVPLDRPR